VEWYPVSTGQTRSNTINTIFTIDTQSSINKYNFNQFTMGRYSSVQAYADNSANNRSVSYEQATGKSEVKGGTGTTDCCFASLAILYPQKYILFISLTYILIITVKTEKIINPYGSTAGAGSGEFHVYRHARARERERFDELDQAELEELQKIEFQEKLQQYEAECAERTEKRRNKRNRAKEAKRRKMNLEKIGIDTSCTSTTTAAAAGSSDQQEEEFEYVSVRNGTNADTTQGAARSEPVSTGSDAIEKGDVGIGSTTT
jgi:hypothetical protein